MMNIKQIKPEDTYEIRQKVLRPNQTINECKYEGDEFKGSFHIGAFAHEKLICIASFYHQAHLEIEGSCQYRLRGMATLEEFRNLKAGSNVIYFAENLLKKQGADVWWCNARTDVEAYYQKLGLCKKGDVFNIDPLGPHIIMYKML
ncbi:GNAT family N-acetyltransferase [Metabacillus arenae]|uniref:N-acetyltransferase n=1 Tax=Metabacillus arenae TaxID=2771434 RepID=A0A926RW11_9BACI|nr:GNAT family N-acetyltransferase [Metabacillus arenae]MBD1380283.1 N-acetyltransferase [Metabacillus arenae]